MYKLLIHAAALADTDIGERLVETLMNSPSVKSALEAMTTEDFNFVDQLHSFVLIGDPAQKPPAGLTVALEMKAITDAQREQIIAKVKTGNGEVSEVEGGHMVKTPQATVALRGTRVTVGDQALIDNLLGAADHARLPVIEEALGRPADPPVVFETADASALLGRAKGAVPMLDPNQFKAIHATLALESGLDLTLKLTTPAAQQAQGLVGLLQMLLMRAHTMPPVQQSGFGGLIQKLKLTTEEADLVARLVLTPSETDDVWARVEERIQQRAGGSPS